MPLRPRARAALLLAALATLSAPALHAQDDPNPDQGSRNKPERLEWFRDQGFGLMIHIGVDLPLGAVISHSLVGASPEYVQRFYTDLPHIFDPHAADPADWARLARTAGVRYMLFTTKHHSGFAMWDTKTTPFNIMATPFHRDLTRDVFSAFRAEGIPAGVYFSPDDFLWLRNHNKPLTRWIPAVQPSSNPGLLQLDRDQIRELLTRYGPVDLLFLDGEARDLRETAWNLDPNLLVTRGAIQTPEQNIPGIPLPGAWEAIDTIGSAWQYQSAPQTSKSTPDLLRELIQTRARGGNFLLNIGPRPDGTLDPLQEDRLREIGLWMFVNSDSIYSTRPWVITNEGNLWFTASKPTSAPSSPTTEAPSSRPKAAQSAAAAEGPASSALQSLSSRPTRTGSPASSARRGESEVEGPASRSTKPQPTTPAPRTTNNVQRTTPSTLYISVLSDKPWPRATFQEFILHSVRATPSTHASVLGQNDRIVEYHPDLTPTTTFHQEPDGLHIRALAAQRLVDNYRWPNPVVLKLENVLPALTPPHIETLAGTRSPDGTSATLHARLLTLGDSTSLPVTFEFRSLAGEDTSTRTAAWTSTPPQTLTEPGDLAATITGLHPNEPYEFRATVHHPLLDLPGAPHRLPIPPQP